MYKDILKVLCCPSCRSNFILEEHELEGDEVVEGIITCDEGHRYRVHKGIIDFGAEEQLTTNRWSESYKETDYLELDKKIELMKSDKDKEQQKMVIDALISEVSKMNNGYIVDIASGRGMLLVELADSIGNHNNIISTDLSFEVLMYDRMKIKKSNPHCHVNYFACDATNLPLKSNTVDITVSYLGIANMIGKIEYGIKEALRITKPEGNLIYSHILIKVNSKGYKILKEICSENNIIGEEKSYIEKDIDEVHSKYFTEVSKNVVFEDIKEEENKLDLLPFQGDWFANVIYKCKK